MQINTGETPFSGYMSRHLLYEVPAAGKDKGEVWLSLASESKTLFGFQGPSAPGLLLLNMTEDAPEEKAVLRAFSSYAELLGTKGRIQFAIDEAALLLMGTNCGLKITAKLKRGETAGLSGEAVVLNLGESSYLISVKRGKLKLSVDWDLKGLCSTDPIIEISPEDGGFEAVFYDTDRALSVNDALSQSPVMAEYKQMVGLKSFSSSTRIYDEEAACKFYTSFMNFSGNILFVRDKKSAVYADLLENCLAALAFRSENAMANHLINVLCSMSENGLCGRKISDSCIPPETYPPIWGLIMLCAYETGALDPILSEKLSMLIKKAAGWWERSRLSPDGMFFYAYPFESGINHKSLLPPGEPSCSPDIEALMAANFRLLSILATSPDERKLYSLKSDEALEKLSALMKGEKYICRSASSGKESDYPEKLSKLAELCRRAVLTENFKASNEDIMTIFAAYTDSKNESSLLSAAYRLSVGRK